MRTSGSSTPRNGEAELTSAAEGSRARTSASPEGERASGRATGADCGSSSPGWFARLDPDMSSWRTPQGCLFEGWTLFSGTWPSSGMMRAGVCSARPRSEPRTSAGGCSSWPTPDAGYLVRSEQGMNHPRRQITLSTRAAHWPTPNVPNGGRTLSPEAIAAKGATEKGKRQVGLGNAVQLWGTPTSSNKGGSLSVPTESRLSTQAERDFWRTPTSGSANSMRGGGQNPQKRLEGGHAVNLQDQVSVFSPQDPPTGTPGSSSSKERRTLNPLFVEALMGFPEGFSALEPLAMPSSPWFQRMRSALCGLGWRTSDDDPNEEADSGTP